MEIDLAYQQQFKLENVTYEAYALIGRVVTIWGSIDGFLIEMLIKEGDLPAGTGHFIIGRMDSRVKMNKVIGLVKWRKKKEWADILKRYSSSFGELKDIRNIFSHWYLHGADETGENLLFTDFAGTNINDDGIIVTPSKKMGMTYLRDTVRACIQFEQILRTGDWLQEQPVKYPEWIKGGDVAKN